MAQRGFGKRLWVVFGAALAMLGGCEEDSVNQSTPAPAVQSEVNVVSCETKPAADVALHLSSSRRRSLGVFDVGVTKIFAAQSAGPKIREERVYYGNLPVCGLNRKVYTIGGRTYSSDDFSYFAAQEGLVVTLAPQGFAIGDLLAVVGQHTAAADQELVLHKQESCLQLLPDGSAVQAEALWVSLGERPFYFVVDDQQIYASGALELHATSGQATIYDQNPQQGNLVAVPLTGLDGSGYLNSERFVSVIKTSVPEEAVKSEELNFSFDVDSNGFIETSVFANAELMGDWFLTMGSKEIGCIQIELHPFTDRFGSDNALYQPEWLTSSKHPQIHIYDDGPKLKNLRLDFDVVAHELGHHIVSRSLTAIDDLTTVTIHEGLADFFVFAKTGNGCLAESICREGNEVCQVDSSCLRSAELNLKYSDFIESPHFDSQVISKWLYGMTATLGRDNVGRTVVASIKYMSSKGTYKGLIKGVMAADRELNGGANACAYYDSFAALGFADLIASVNCQDYAP